MARILVVDDELSIREYLEMLLTRSGHVVELAESVEVARGLLTSRSYDLAIIDSCSHLSSFDHLRIG